MTTTSSATRAQRKGMRWIPGGTFAMGSEDHYPEEAPVHEATVEGFWLDEHPVTNLEFTRFVKETGHVTVAEVVPEPDRYPGAKPELLFAGSVIFQRSTGPVDLTTPTSGGRGCAGPTGTIPKARRARCRARTSPRRARRLRGRRGVRSLGGQGAADARPSGSSPRAAVSTAPSSPGATSIMPNGSPQANTWQGEFPYENPLLDGYEGTSPVGLPAERLWARGHDRQRLGVDDRLVHGRSRGCVACCGADPREASIDPNDPPRSRARS